MNNDAGSPSEPTTTRSAVTRRSALKLAGSGALAAAAATVATGVAAAAGTPDPGPTPTAAPAVAPTHQVGRFLLWLNTSDAGGNPSLTIAHSEDPTRPLWASVPGSSFLTGGSADTVIDENTTPASGFVISDRNLVRFDQQSVSTAEIRDGALVLTGSLAGSDRTVTYQMTWSAVGDRQLRFTITIADADAAHCNRLFLRYASAPDERFYGFGQQMTFFDQKNRLIPILVQEHGVGRGLPIITQLVDLAYGPRTAGNPATTEVSVPHYITSKQRSLFLENTRYSVFDLRYPDRVEIEVFADQLTGQILYGRTPLELIETYTSYSGRMRELPDWIHDGAIICIEGGSGEAQWAIDTFDRSDVPVAAFWFQDWTGTNHTVLGDQVQWNWEVSTAKYPDFPAIRTALADRLGAKVMLYVNPFLTNADGFNRLYGIAESRGYFVKNQAGTTYGILNGGFYAGLIDLSNPEAKAWIQQVIEDNLITAVGATGWMADFGEALPFDAVLASGENPADWHNRYPEEWAQVNRNAIENKGLGNDGLFFSRSGFTKSPGISTLFWLGDQLQTWDEYDGLKSAINGALSGGVSGFSLVHSDIGGFDSIAVPRTDPPLPVIYRNAELLSRWAEFAAFTPVMRTHVGIAPALAWQVDRNWESLQGFRRCVNMYRAWAPFRRKLVAEAAATGHPIMRHLALEFSGDPVTETLRHQYLLGDALLVAPVTEPGAAAVDVYLPAGSWTSPWTSTTIIETTGSWYTAEAPMGQPAVFVRDDAAQLRSAFAALGGS